ncbi:S-locus-specific glycoprotein S6 [Hibiscus syriacus]|uniref:S-locus-specific glycoprotein S6 n=1 Tax=Hibiscus syriacus TaxID=106335 RepID=A0A6A3CAA7_HIBSY|nr:S-locus-specific glycoprotein S6 [Hibiscus syriacus]
METRNKNPDFDSLVSLIFLLYSFAQSCYSASDTVRQGDTLRDGYTLVSEKNVFELGFFSPENSSFSYLGIWYKFDSKTVVWVANRDEPISGCNGVLRIEDDGKLVIRDGNDGVVWSSYVPCSSNKTAAKLLSEGNFVLSRDDGTRRDPPLWQSFDEPTDTFFPGMKVPVRYKRGECRPFRSWKSPDDPSPGNYSLGVDPNGGLQIVILDNNNKRRWRSGQWNQQFFTGLPSMRNTASYFHGFVISHPNENGTMYITYTVPKHEFFRFQISWEGREKQSSWNAGEKKWDYLNTEPDPDNQCELYNFCGNYSICDRSRKCICLKGFRPRSQAQWDASNWP